MNADGDQVGVVPVAAALNAARKAGSDLVEVASRAVPPVVRIMDYGKFKYEQSKKRQAAKRSGGGVKEMQYRPRIADHDFDTKTRKVAGFIEDGDKVKITVRLRGRERSMPHLAREVVDRVLDDLGDDVRLEHPPKGEGWQVSAVIAPA